MIADGEDPEQVKAYNNNQQGWSFQANDPAFSGHDTLYGPVVNGKAFVIVHSNDPGDPEQWECGVLDVNDNYQPLMDEFVWAEDKSEVEDWLDNANLPHPPAQDWKSIGL